MLLQTSKMSTFFCFEYRDPIILSLEFITQKNGILNRSSTKTSKLTSASQFIASYRKGQNRLSSH